MKNLDAIIEHLQRIKNNGKPGSLLEVSIMFSDGSRTIYRRNGEGTFNLSITY